MLMLILKIIGDNDSQGEDMILTKENQVLGDPKPAYITKDE